jgi:hypothetical protein
LDWLEVCDEVREPAKVVGVAEKFLAGRDAMQETFAHTRRIARACPESDGARVIGELLAGIKRVTGARFMEKVRKLRTRMKRRACRQA